MLDEGVGDGERRWRRGARKRGKQRRGGEVRSYVAVHHARVGETGDFDMILPSGPWSTSAIIARTHRFWWCESLCAPHQSPS